MTGDVFAVHFYLALRDKTHVLNNEGSGVSGGEPEAMHVQRMAEAPRRGSLHWIGTALSGLLFTASLVVLYNILSNVEMAKSRPRLAMPAAGSSHGGVFTVISYSLLTFYDVLALRQLRARIRYRIIALASFTSYAISFTLGFPILTAGTCATDLRAARSVGREGREPDVDRGRHLPSRHGHGARRRAAVSRRCDLAAQPISRRC